MFFFLYTICVLVCSFVHSIIFIFLLSFIYSFSLLESGNAEDHVVQPPAPLTEPVATLACLTASPRVPVLLAGAGKSGTSCSSDWSTALRDYSYHSSTSTLANSRAKVTSVSVQCVTI